MANPQLENGFTMVANEILEALVKINLSSYESRVLWFIIRKTYGWHRPSDWIALSQIVKGTGIDKRNVWRTMKSLERRNLIIRPNPKQLGFQKNYALWVNKKRIPARQKVAV